MKQSFIDFGNIPKTFAVCYNSTCQQCNNCLRYAAGKHQQDNRITGPAVYPPAWQNGTCQCFRPLEKVRMAWGFSQLYSHLDPKTATLARAQVQRYFSSGVGPYYRYHHGERLLTPDQQRDILAIIAQYGSVDSVHFDHYECTLDLT